MEKKVVFITGAGSGLGASLAAKFTAPNYHICLAGRNEEKLNNIASSLNTSNSVHQLDISDRQQVNQVFNHIQQEIGDIDILINNAGVGAFKLAEEITEQEIDQMIDINLKGTIHCTQAVLNNMKKRNEGTIVNVVSTAGLIGKVNETVYCASKFGVRGFTESLLLELAHTEVRLNAVYVGGMKTEFWTGIQSEEETKDLMDPDDIADIIIDNIETRKLLNVSDIVIKNKK